MSVAYELNMTCIADDYDGNDALCELAAGRDLTADTSYSLFYALSQISITLWTSLRRSTSRVDLSFPSHRRFTRRKAFQVNKNFKWQFKHDSKNQGSFEFGSHCKLASLLYA